MTIDRSKANTPSTAIPTRRNGKLNTQTMGQSSSASNASGQHTSSSNNQSNNFSMSVLLWKLISLSALRPASVVREVRCSESGCDRSKIHAARS